MKNISQMILRGNMKLILRSRRVSEQRCGMSRLSDIMLLVWLNSATGESWAKSPPGGFISSLFRPLLNLVGKISLQQNLCLSSCLKTATLAGPKLMLWSVESIPVAGEGHRRILKALNSSKNHIQPQSTIGQSRKEATIIYIVKRQDMKLFKWCKCLDNTADSVRFLLD